MQGPQWTPSFRDHPAVLMSKPSTPNLPASKNGHTTKPTGSEVKTSREVNKKRVKHKQARMMCKQEVQSRSTGTEAMSKSLSKPVESMNEVKVNKQGKTSSDKR